MTSRTPDSSSPAPSPPTPQIFSIFSLPSYENAVKSSGDPPPYEEALTDLSVEDLEAQFRDSLPPDTSPRPVPHQAQVRQTSCQQRVRLFCCWLAASIITMLAIGTIMILIMLRSL